MATLLLKKISGGLNALHDRFDKLQLDFQDWEEDGKLGLVKTSAEP